MLPDDVAEAEQAESVTAETVETDKPHLTEVEQRARRMNWKPKDEYIAAGKDEATWVDAEAFVNKIESDLPDLRKQNKKLAKTVDKLERGMEEGNKLLRDLVTSQKAERDKAVATAIANLKRERAEATSNGDAARVEQLSDEIETQKESLKAPVAAERERPKADEIPQEVVQWAEDNKAWFITGEPEHALAVSFYGKQPQKMPEAEKLRLTKAEVVRRYPEKFANPRRTEIPDVDTGGGGTRNRNGAKSWGDLPAEARDIGERLVKQGAVKSREAYLKSYPW